MRGWDGSEYKVSIREKCSVGGILCESICMTFPIHFRDIIALLVKSGDVTYRSVSYLPFGRIWARAELLVAVMIVSFSSSLAVLWCSTFQPINWHQAGEPYRDRMELRHHENTRNTSTAEHSGYFYA